MKTRNLISLMTCIIAASATACSAESPAPEEATVETTATSQQELIAGAGNMMIWPAGPIVWDGLVGTWPISIWSSGAIGAVAFDLTGLTGLGVGLLSPVGLGLTPIGITTPYLNAFIPPVGAVGVGLGTPFLGAAGLNAGAFGYGGAYTPWLGAGGFGFGAYGAGAAVTATAGLTGAFLTPMLTTSALMFNNLAFVDTFTPFTFNLTFTAQSAAFAASTAAMGLSIFATPIMPGFAAGAAFPFTSMAFPIMGMPLAATAAATPLLL